MRIARAILAMLIAALAPLLATLTPVAASATQESVGSTATHESAASTASQELRRADRCRSFPTKLYKAGNAVIGVMKLDCKNREELMRINTVFARTGGGAPAKTVYKDPIYCTEKFVCIATVGMTDIPGQQKYWFTNEPTTGQGTMVTGGGDGSDAYCYTGISCFGANGYF